MSELQLLAFLHNIIRNLLASFKFLQVPLQLDGTFTDLDTPDATSPVVNNVELLPFPSFCAK